MRKWAVLAAAALVLAACGDGTVRVETDGAGANIPLDGKDGGYSLNVFTDGATKTFLVVRPDGMQVASVVDASGARLVDAGDAHAAMSETVSSMPAPEGEKVSIQGPGLSIQVKGDDTKAEDERANIQIKVGGKEVTVDAGAAEGGEGPAVVKVAGVDAKAAVKFIDDAEGLTPEVRAQMKEKLGLK